MTDLKLVFIMAVTGGAVVRTISGGRDCSMVEQVVKYANDIDSTDLEKLVKEKSLDDIVSEYLDYQFSSEYCPKQPEWLRKL